MLAILEEAAVTVALILILLTIAFFITIILFLELGRRTARRRAARGAPVHLPGMAAVEGSIFGLMGLLLAFSFHGAADRLFARRAQIVVETNAIGTAWLRLSALPADTQPAIRDLFRRYLDSRLATHRNVLNDRTMTAEIEKSEALQAEIWRLVMAALERPEGQRAIVVVVNSLNEMFDMRTTRLMAMRQHPPTLIFVVLGVLVCAGAFIAGNGMIGVSSSRWLYPIMFAGILSFTLYVIVDMEFPRAGIIRLDSFDTALVELRQSMDAPNRTP